MKSRLSALILMTLPVALAAATVAAQPPPRPSPEERLKADLAEMKDKLALTDEQMPKVEAILKDRSKEMEADRGKFGDDREAMMKAMRDRNKKYDDLLNALFTDKQKADYEKLKTERRDRMRQRGGPDGPPKG